MPAFPLLVIFKQFVEQFGSNRWHNLVALGGGFIKETCVPLFVSNTHREDNTIIYFREQELAFD
jgi:hypothetical protein